jgi:RNA-binding protein
VFVSLSVFVLVFSPNLGYYREGFYCL